MLEKLPEFVGHALSNRRAGLENILFNKVDPGELASGMEVSSAAFGDFAPIPKRFTADGGSVISPPLQWQNVPAEATTLALIVEDADSPTSEPLVHAIAVDIDPRRDGILEGELIESLDGAVASLGRNSFLTRSWLPPDPPPGHGQHRYAFQLFALRDGKPFSATPGRSELIDAIRDRAVSGAYFIGTYERATRVKSGEESESLVEALQTASPEVPKVGSTDAPGG